MRPEGARTPLLSVSTIFPPAPSHTCPAPKPPALVIEIIDGSAAAARRTVISKEDRRALFDYFKHRPSRPLREDRAASNAHESSGGGGGGGEAGSPAPSVTPPPGPCSPVAAAAAAVVEAGGGKGAEEPAVKSQVLNADAGGAEGVMLAPSSGAAAGFSPWFPVVRGQQVGGKALDAERPAVSTGVILLHCVRCWVRSSWALARTPLA